MQEIELASEAIKKNTKPAQRMAELDGLRALAILFVIMFHSWFFLQFTMKSTEDFLAYSDSLPWIFGFIRRGDLGVDIFFVLSGYLLSWQLFRKRMSSGRVDLKRFYAHRIFRIYPIYIIALLIALLGGGFSWAVLGNLFAFNIWTDTTNIIIPWTWSLSVELEFYAIVPLLIFMVRNGASMIFLTIAFALLTIGWNIWILANHPQLANFSLIDLKIAGQNDTIDIFNKYLYIAMPVRLNQFVFGMAGAWVLLNRSDYLSGLGALTKTMLIAFVIIGAAAPLINNPFTHLTEAMRPLVYIEQVFGRVVFAAAIALMIVLLHSNTAPKLKKILSIRILEPIARFSFSMYLFHPLFIYLGFAIFIGTEKVSMVSAFQQIGVFLVALAGSMLFGLITWYTIERPAIRYGRKKFG